MLQIAFFLDCEGILKRVQNDSGGISKNELRFFQQDEFLISKIPDEVRSKY
jgi:hypothetical protein